MANTITQSTRQSIGAAVDQAANSGLSKLEQDTLAGLDKGSPEYKRAHASLMLNKLRETVAMVMKIIDEMGRNADRGTR